MDIKEIYGISNLRKVNLLERYKTEIQHTLNTFYKCSGIGAICLHQRGTGRRTGRRKAVRLVSEESLSAYSITIKQNNIP